MAIEALVRINYRSGISQEFWFREFNIKRHNSEVTSIEAKWADPKQTSLMFGLGNIESIFQVAVREVSDEVKDV